MFQGAALLRGMVKQKAIAGQSSKEGERKMSGKA